MISKWDTNLEDLKLEDTKEYQEDNVESVTFNSVEAFH